VLTKRQLRSLDVAKIKTVRKFLEIKNREIKSVHLQDLLFSQKIGWVLEVREVSLQLHQLLFNHVLVVKLTPCILNLSFRET